MAELEEFKGRKVIRGADGKFEAVSLDPDVAAAMGRRSHGAARETSVETLLREAGYPDPEEAPEHLRLLAGLAAGGKSGAVQSLQAFLRLTRPAEYKEGGGVAPGEICPTCGQYNFFTPQGAETAKKILRLLDDDEILLELISSLRAARGEISSAHPGETGEKP